MAVSPATLIGRVMGKTKDQLLQTMANRYGPSTGTTQFQQPTAAPNVNPTIPQPPAPTPAPQATTVPNTGPVLPNPGTASPLVQQMMGQPQQSGGPQTTAQQFYAQGGVLPGGLVDQPSVDAYMKQHLLSQRQQVSPEVEARMRAERGLPGPENANIVSANGQVLQQGQGGQLGQGSPLGGGLPGQPGQAGQISFAGIPPQLMQSLTQALQGQGIPQANAQAPAIDPELLAAIKGQIAGEGMPSFDQVIQGTYEPWSALMDDQFNTQMTSAFEQMVSRGVLQSGETQNRLTEMARQQGLTKGAYLGQLALDYTKERQQQVQSAIQQWGVLDANRASNQTTITTANLQAAVQIQGIAMQTLTNLTTAMAQIGSAEKIAGADIASRERIAGMDIQSRNAIAQMQTSMQQTVAQIGAQAMLQAANFDKQTAHENVTASMALEGIDWDRFLSDPEYAANVTNAIAIEKDIHLAIDQADAVDTQLQGAGRVANPRA